MKKLILSIIFTFAFYVFVPTAFAFTFSASSPLEFNGIVEITGVSVDNTLQIFNAEDVSVASWSGGSEMIISLDDIGEPAQTFRFVECQTTLIGEAPYTTEIYCGALDGINSYSDLVSGIVSESFFAWSEDLNPLPVSYTSGYSVGSAPQEMNDLSATGLLSDTAGNFGNALLIILGMFLGIAVAYLVFRFGWKAVKRSTNGGVAEGAVRISNKEFKRLSRANGYRGSWKDDYMNHGA